MLLSALYRCLLKCISVILILYSLVVVFHLDSICIVVSLKAMRLGHFERSVSVSGPTMELNEYFGAYVGKQDVDGYAARSLDV